VHTTYFPAISLVSYRGASALNLEQILSELRSERDRLGRAISSLLEGAGLTTPSGTPGKRGPAKVGKRRGMSAAGRKRISEAMKARWAARKKPTANSRTAIASAPKKRGGGMTAQGRKRISEAMKKRWAEKRQANGKGDA
jgi:hypothetical protein